MKNNIILLTISVMVCLVIIELYSYQKVKNKIEYNLTRLGNKKDINEFINDHIKTLHHLKSLRRNTKTLEELIYTKIGSGNKKVLIQGDSWAELIEREKKSKKLLLETKDAQFLLAGTSSYSPSLMSAQLNIIREGFGERPEIIIAIIDQTDLGDELCRYRTLRKVINGKVVVKPVPQGEPNLYNVHNIFEKSELLESRLPFTLRLIKYELLNKQILKRITNLQLRYRCGYEEILGILKENIIENDLIYWNDVFNEYINNVFSNSYTKHLFVVTHPHKDHLSNDYVLDINDLIIDNIDKSKFKNKITLVNTHNYKKMKLNDVFIEKDKFSHLQTTYMIKFYLPIILKFLNEYLTSFDEFRSRKFYEYRQQDASQ